MFYLIQLTLLIEHVVESNLPEYKLKTQISPKTSPTQKITSVAPLLEARSTKRHPVSELTLNPDSVKALTNVLQRHIAKVEHERSERHKIGKDFKNPQFDEVGAKQMTPLVTEKFKLSNDSQSNHITNVIYKMEPVIAQQNEDAHDNKISDKIEHNNNVQLRKPKAISDFNGTTEHITTNTKILNGNCKTNSFLSKKTSRPLSYIENGKIELNEVSNSDDNKIDLPKNGNAVESGITSNGLASEEYPVCHECKTEIRR